MIDLVNNVITVPCEGESYALRIPTPFDQIAIGVKQKEILAKSYPNFNPVNLDQFTESLLNGLALFEILITKGTTATWVWFADKNGKPAVDSSKFPAEAIRIVLEVTNLFQNEFDKFLYPGLYTEQPEQETVESKPDPE